jgi:hypothetical protein
MKNSNTSAQYDEVILECRKIFLDKMFDYGTAWRILRSSSLTDQIYIKAARIRSIQIQKVQKVEDNIRQEFIGIVNYSIMALIQLQLGETIDTKMSSESVEKLYMHFFQTAKTLMEQKNHDYSEAWRDMRISSIDDIILMKLLRIKEIEDHEGKTIASEGLDANYLDVINYSVFALIKTEKEKKTA